MGDDGLLARLIEAPGLYVGVGKGFAEQEPDPPWLARIMVTVLPGRAAVSLDYEARSVASLRQHAEHAVLGRGSEGLVLVTVHTHADRVTVLYEDGAGRFVDRDGTSPFPVEIHVDAPAKGRLVHQWWYGRPGEVPVKRDTAELELLDAGG